MPMEATTKIVAAVVSPVTLPFSWRIDPAPMKPMPGMIWAAIRVRSPRPNSEARSKERIVNMAAPKQMNMLVRRPALQFALKADHAPQNGRQRQAREGLREKIREHLRQEH